jgi:hypothetical protein
MNSLGVVFSIPYPEFFNSMVGYLGVISLDILTVMPIGCTVDLNHDHYLLMRTLIPILLLFLSFQYRWKLIRFAKRSAPDEHNDKDEQALANYELADRLLTYNFILVYLLFPSNSANIFATFQCETLDDMEASSVLRIDLSVDCKTTFHQAMMVYAGLMVFIYPIGVPALYAYLLLYQHRAELRLLHWLELKRAGLLKDNVNTTELHDAYQAIDGNISATESLKKELTARKARRRSSIHAQKMMSQSYKKTGPRFRHAVEIAKLKLQEEKLRQTLPDYVQKLILGYGAASADLNPPSMRGQD